MNIQQMMKQAQQMQERLQKQMAELRAEATSGGGAQSADANSADRKTALRDKALADAGVQAMLEVFPAEIRDVEEM